MSSATALYREYAPCEALRGFVRAFFSFSEPTEEADSRPASLEARFTSRERVCAPTFADGHACVVFSFARQYGPDGVWRSGAVPSSADIIGPMTISGPPSVPTRRESLGAYLRAGSVIPGVSAPELEDRIVALDAVWGGEAHLLSEDLEALQGETAHRLFGVCPRSMDGSADDGAAARTLGRHSGSGGVDCR